MMSRFFNPPRPRLFGHRGCATKPENTLPAFQEAAKSGLTYMELDVRGTCDRQVVVHHDASTRRLCGVDRKITRSTLAELKELDAGFTFSPDSGKSFPFRGKSIIIPTLAEVLTDLPDIFFTIEIKQRQPAIEDLVLQSILEAGAWDRVLLASEHDMIVEAIRHAAPELPTGLGFSEVDSFYNWLAGKRKSFATRGLVLQIPDTYRKKTLATRKAVKAAHALGLEVHVWTVNARADMNRLLDLGVDGLVGDYPELLAATAAEFTGSCP